MGSFFISRIVLDFGLYITWQMRSFFFFSLFPFSFSFSFSIFFLFVWFVCNWLQVGIWFGWFFYIPVLCGQLEYVYY
ncbi:hypothetical protein DFH27DRAFT_556215, partial [Peziza echinospora]